MFLLDIENDIKIPSCKVGNVFNSNNVAVHEVDFSIWPKFVDIK
jgi:hypothetical protein